MKKYSLKIEPEALSDIKEAVDWYSKAQKGLGKRFKNTVIKQIDSLSKNPQVYAIRYRDIRCMLIKKFPYMVHFYLNDEDHTVEVLALISTDRNPKIWEKKTTKH